MMEREDFIHRFRHGSLPDEIPEIELSGTGEGLAIGQVLKQSGLTSSTSEAYRMIDQGAVRIDGERISARDTLLPVDNSHVVQVGKRKFARVTIRNEKAE